MTWYQAALLGLLQGTTEFIPVSSSGHLVLVPWLAGWASPGLAFTVMAHTGTALGVLLYFWRDWLAMIKSTWIHITSRETSNPAYKLLVLLILGNIPAAALGVAAHRFFEQTFEQPLFAALMLLVTAGLLVLGERIGKLTRVVSDMIWLDSILIGLMQAIAILPDISRSGATIAGGRMRHLKRDDAARFSFLLATPVIIGAGIFQIFELMQTGIHSVDIEVLVIGFVVAFASTYFVIKWLLSYLRNQSTRVFSIYCFVLSVLCLVVFVARGG